MKKVLTFLAVTVLQGLFTFQVWAYSGSIITSAGTIYFDYISSSQSITIKYPISTPWYGYYDSYWGNYPKPTGDLIIPDSIVYMGTSYPVTTISHCAFANCNALTSVTIPKTIKTIGSEAFIGCENLTMTNYMGTAAEWAAITIPLNGSPVYYSKNLYLNNVLLTDLTFPDTTTIINTNFANDTALHSVTIPNSVTIVRPKAFYECSHLTKTNYIGTAMQWAAIRFEQFGLAQVGSEIVGKANSNPIMYSHNLYLNDVLLTNLVFEDTTIIINDNFNYDTALHSITIPNSVTTISIGAFTGCDGLTSVYIPNTVTHIENGAFHSCGGLSSITIPSTVDSIGSYVFYNCSGLTSVSILNSTISKGEFCDCTNLTSVTIPSSVTSIGGSAFFECTSLTSLTLPSSVTSIGDYAFYGCSNMDSITSLASVPPSLGYMCFNGVNTQIPVFVPCESVSSYQSASGWSDFSNIQCNSGQIYTITATSGNPTMGTVTGGGSYADGATATLTAMPNSGYHFVRWQDNNTQNPRTITVTANATYTAYFEADGGDDDCPTITSFPWNATFDESLSCWKTVDADGDGYNWMNYQDYVVSESYSYFDGTNQGLTPDNWLISQRIQIPSSGTYTLSWTAAGLSDDYYNEHYSVYVSTTGDNPSDFMTQLFSETLNTPNAVNRNVSLNNYRGQTVRIAFRHHNTNDVFVLGIANVKISQGTQGIDDIDENGLLVYVEGDNIRINDGAGQSVMVYAIDGRIISAVTNAAGCLSIPVAAAGVYIVKVGDHPARKVVVIR